MSRLPSLFAALAVLALPAAVVESKDAANKIVNKKDLPYLLECKATWTNKTSRTITLTPFLDTTDTAHGYLAVAVPAGTKDKYERFNLVATGLDVKDGDIPTRNYIQIPAGQEIHITPRYGETGRFKMHFNINIENETFAVMLSSAPSNDKVLHDLAPYKPKTFAQGKGQEKYFDIRNWWEYQLKDKNKKTLRAVAPELEFKALPK